MKIYVLMCLAELVDNKYYTSKKEANKELYRALESIGGGDFWIEELYLAET